MSQRGSRSAIFIGSLQPRKTRGSKKYKEFLHKKDIAVSYQYLDRLKKQISNNQKALQSKLTDEEKAKLINETNDLLKKIELVNTYLVKLHSPKSKKKKKKKKNHNSKKALNIKESENNKGLLMKYYIYKDFRNAIQNLHQAGGVFQGAANKVWSTLGKLKLKEETAENPLKKMQLTDHGETRIEHCLKYELGGGCRLITIQDNNICVFCYIGMHDACEKWLNSNKGLKLTVNKDYELIEAWESRDILDETKRIYTESELSSGYLFEKISDRKYDHIIKGLPRSLQRKFESLTSIATEEEIMELCCKVGDKERENVLYDVFSLLRESDVDGAKNRVDLYINKNLKVENLSSEEIEKIVEGESFIDFENFDGELIEHLMKTTNYHQWMLFMHPEQKKIVEKDFNGPAKLSGVSGSGKTCVLIRRAIRLAKEYSNEKILILTLNKSLAQLIDELKNVATPDPYNKNIEVKSFWKLCQELLLEFEPSNTRLYDEFTWRLREHIDEIWEEYYHCKLNNDDAKAFWILHKSLNSRSIYPFEYIRQEFDWVRSSLSKPERKEYYDIERKGRSELLTKEQREMVLKGLSFWEDKMHFVGVTDYLGLATELYKYYSKLIPRYRCILIDEEQDFGLIELKIIRKLVEEKDNDIFLCGDFAQKVSIKHHSYLDAGINVVGRSSSIKKNYRNSKEILTAAFNVLKNNMDKEILLEEDYEILDPEYANYSNVKPLLLKARSLKEEFGYCYNYFLVNAMENQRVGIAFCGLTLREIKKLGDHLNLPVLDGTISLSKSKIFLSDLEQMKGFEFDYVCILNCNKEVIPNVLLPEKEWYRELSKLYVAMTRAKIELFLSYSSELSPFISNNKTHFNTTNWYEHENESMVEQLMGFTLVKEEDKKDLTKLTGKDILYRKEAVGLSVELQDKLETVITGKSSSENGKQKEWRTIEDAINERNIPVISQAFGTQKTWPDFQDFIKQLKE